LEERISDEVKLKESIVFSDPKDNIQERPEILAQHLRRTGGKVITRFPPEPNVITFFTFFHHLKCCGFVFLF
jgi:glutaminyl-tRNA synthetase